MRIVIVDPNKRTNKNVMSIVNKLYSQISCSIFHDVSSACKAIESEGVDHLFTKVDIDDFGEYELAKAAKSVNDKVKISLLAPRGNKIIN
ncbi:MAG: hypothetical protein HUJ61_03415 [Bacilli bacterium]|nr:hypothetical protein [Bacilli bacterium]